MASAMAERMELAKLCSSKDWAKAIRVLDSLLSQFCAIQDLCNRAFCYSQLELHEHVVKDCDKALQLDPKLLQAYILKGRAFSALGRKHEALLIWEQGNKHAVCQSSDLKQLMELEDLLRIAMQNGSTPCHSHVTESSGSSFSASESAVSEKLSDASNNHGKSNGRTTATSSSTQQVEAHMKLEDGSSVDVKRDNSFGSLSITKHENHTIETNGIHKKKSVGKSALIDSSESSSDLIDFSDLCSEPLSLSEIHNELLDASNRSKKFCVARTSKNKSINVDFRLSRGIAQVNEGKYAYAISIFDKILQEEPDYPEALIGRGTAYAFQGELHSAIADFTKAIQSNPSAGEAWKRRGQARAALGESAKRNNAPILVREMVDTSKLFADFQMAEFEVDLLGDEVDDLLGLLRRVYIVLDHYSLVLQHYPGIIEILELVKRALNGESTAPCYEKIHGNPLFHHK